MFFTSEDEKKITFESVKSYIDKECIWRKGKYDLPIPGKVPGTRYAWMFMIRNGLFKHTFLKDVCLLLLDKVHTEIGHWNFQISGPESSATPIITALPLIAATYGINLNAFMVRKEQKKYGLANWLEGKPNDLPIVLFDDLCNSSIALNHAYRTIAAHSLVAQEAFVIVNKVNKNWHDPLRQKSDYYLPSDFKVTSIYDCDDFDLSVYH
jgi:orotate phosphoribosyltransferase